MGSNLPMLKTLAIFAMAALAIIMAGQLWFINFANRGFFLYIQARFPGISQSEQEAFVRPMRISYGTDGLIGRRYGGECDVLRFSKQILKRLVHGSYFVGVIPHSAVYDGSDLIILEYAFDMRADTYAMALGARNHAAFERAGVSRFHAVVIKPAVASHGYVRVYFIFDDTAHIFRIPPNRTNPLAELMFELPAVGPPLFYAHDGELYPSHGFYFKKALAHNPYENAFGLLHLSFIRAQIAPFFANPATISPSISAGGIYTFSNLNTIVRYYEFDVIEYSSYRALSRLAPAGLLSDFSAALSFISDDVHVSQDVFLAQYEMRGRENAFRFNLTLDGFPLTLAEPWHTGPGCTEPLITPIEVVVDHGRVVRYRRIAYDFTPGAATWFNTDEYCLHPISLGFYVQRGEVEFGLRANWNHGFYE